MAGKVDLRKYLKTLPPLGTTEDLDPTKVKVVKVFWPYGNGTWKLCEYDPKDDLAYGLCDLGLCFAEYGYVSVAEIDALAFMGMPECGAEVDLHWHKTWADVKAEHEFEESEAPA
jgi:hypothetical protein